MRVVSLSRAKIIGRKKTQEREKNSFGNYAPKTHAEHREVTNAESRMETAGEEGQECAVEKREGDFTIAARKSGWVGKETIN